MKLSELLQKRGFIHQFSAETLEEIVDGEKRTVYLGVDPSADSIHAGNFAIWMLLRHLADAGFKIIFLSGGGTGMIGDPKPDAERELKTVEEVQENARKISEQAKRILNLENITFVNNYDWLKKVPLIDFLRDVGKHFTVNELIKKDAIATRLSSETGLSYTEFAYPLLQGYDYYVLNQEHSCDLQVGGSDQWGNIIAGVDLVRRKAGKKVYAITAPLIIDKATGKKFGKSEGNAVWLDTAKTSVYTFYQFWLNVSDENVIDYLKIFTLLSLEEIATLETTTEEAAHERKAQKALAAAVTEIVHGEKAAETAATVSSVLFGGEGDITPEVLDMLRQDAPNYTPGATESVVEVLIGAGLASSKREAREFLSGGAVTIDGEKITDEAYIPATQYDTHALLRRGKKQVCVLVKKNNE